MRLLVLADTHIRDGSARDLPAMVWDLAAAADVILHGGDVIGWTLLTRLSSIAPTYAVLGNNDHELAGVVPEQRVVELDGVQIGMTHDSGPRARRAERLHRWFPGCAVVVFGHSHEPCDELGVDGQRLFNPGSAIERRRQVHHTVGLLEIADGVVVDHEIRIVHP
ncbi:MAG: metallophosphoesterase family protein [Acidimicrobiia bacterium]